MSYRIEVDADGKVHVDVPNAPTGAHVRVIVETKPDLAQTERIFGRLKGKIQMLPGFDEPIEGLEWAAR